MNSLLYAIVFILSPFIYGYGYVTEWFKVKSDFKRIKEIAENNFRPFFLDTNQISQEVNTRNDLIYVYLKFKKAYPKIDFLDLKINKHDYSLQNQALIKQVPLISFGLRSEHTHDIDYTLEDFFLS